MAESRGGSGCLIFILGIVCAIGYMKWNPSSEHSGKDRPGRTTQSSEHLAPEQGRFESGDMVSVNNTEVESPRYVRESPSSNPHLPRTAEDEEQDDSAEKLRLALEWQNVGKRQSIERLNAMKTSYDSRTSCPAYRYARSLANEARAAIIKYERAIGYDDYVNVEKCFAEASGAMQRFEMNCRWQAGVSKGSGSHMHSGQVEGTWELDSGYVQVGGRVARVRKCGKCNGHGQVSGYDGCSRCNGTGKIPNPTAQFSEGVNVFAGMLNGAASKGRGPRFRAPNVNVRSSLPCDACNGRGRISVIRQCPQCGGQGKVYD